MTKSSLVALAALIIMPYATETEGQSTARIPQYVIKDSMGAVVGAYSDSSTSGSLLVLFHDDANDENYDIQLGANFARGADTSDVYYTAGDCTGTAYVFAPSFLSSSLPGLRGSVYAIGRSAGATNEDCVIVRGAGAGSDNDAVINSRYRTNANTGPTCSAVDPGVDTVQAQVIDNTVFCGLTRPFVAE